MNHLLKKTLASVLSAGMLLSFIPSAYAEDNIGDLDGDGDVTSADALMALRISAGLQESNENLLAVADIDGDGSITSADALGILRSSAGFLPSDNADDGKLQDILNALVKPGSSYNEYKAYFPTTEFTEKIEGNKIVITAAGEGNNSINDSFEMVREGDYLVYHSSNQNSFFGALLLMDVGEAVAETLGMDSRLMPNYMNGMIQSDIKSDKFFAVKNKDGSIDYKLYIAAPFEMKELEQMYVGDSMLSYAEPLTDEMSISYVWNTGKLTIIMNARDKGMTLFVKEYGTLDDLAVKSVINIVKAYQPNGYQTLVNNFTKFESTSNSAYSVDANPGESVILEYDNEKEKDYSYGIIEIK